MYYWIIRYFSVLFLLFCFFLDFELVWVVFFFFNIHLFLGIKSILKDYIHQNELKLLFVFLSRIFLIFIFTLTLEIIF